MDRYTIKNTFGLTIFSYACEDNTFAKTVEEAVKRGVSLAYVDFSSKDLSNINLDGKDLSHADFRHCNLINANLRNTNLQFSAFNCAIIRNTNFTGANLKNVYSLNSWTFKNAILTDVIGINDQCPKEGSFIGWKKCYNGIQPSVIVKLEIPANARRCSAINSGVNIKCRCSQAKVLEIQNIDGTIADVKEVYSWYDKNFVYRVNEYIYPDWFDGNFWSDCSHGIHFFMKRDEAVNW